LVLQHAATSFAELKAATPRRKGVVRGE